MYIHRWAIESLLKDIRTNAVAKVGDKASSWLTDVSDKDIYALRSAIMAWMVETGNAPNF